MRRVGLVVLALIVAVGVATAAAPSASKLSLGGDLVPPPPMMKHEFRPLLPAPVDKDFPEKPLTGTYTVNCDRGQSVNAALTRPGMPLTLNIIGTCRESVQVYARPCVNLVGAASGATIQPPAGQPAIEVMSADQLVVSNLTLTGADDGVAALGSRGMHLDHVTITGNQGSAIFLESSDVLITDSSMTNNAAAIGAFKHSTARLVRSDLSNSPSAGAQIEDHSRLELDHSTMLGNAWGFILGYHSSLDMRNQSRVQSTGSIPGVGPYQGFLWEESTAWVQFSRLEMPGVLDHLRSSLTLQGSTLDGTLISIASYVCTPMYGPVPSLVTGNLILNSSDWGANAAPARPVAGVVVCGGASHVSMENPPPPQPPESFINCAVY